MRFLAAVALTAACAFASQEDDVRRVLDAQVAAWNRGDIPAFMRTYATDTVFVGKEVTHGSRDVEARYARSYSTPEKMGRLSFSEIEIRPVGVNAAYAIGRWQIDRTAEAGGAAAGRFSLVFEKRGSNWLIVLDHTQ